MAVLHVPKTTATGAARTALYNREERSPGDRGPSVAVDRRGALSPRRKAAMATEVRPFRVSDDVLDDAAELRRRLDQEGYLFIRRLVDPEPLWELRAEMLAVLRDGGWLQPGTDPLDGVA